MIRNDSCAHITGGQIDVFPVFDRDVSNRGTFGAERVRNEKNSTEEPAEFSGIDANTSEETGLDGPNWTRTSDFHDVNVAL